MPGKTIIVYEKQLMMAFFMNKDYRDAIVALACEAGRFVPQ